jgi:hypothetical protein
MEKYQRSQQGGREPTKIAIKTRQEEEETKIPMEYKFKKKSVLEMECKYYFR